MLINHAAEVDDYLLIWTDGTLFCPSSETEISPKWILLLACNRYI
jgi:hypothetical protein